jgi:PAS domain S-box-containing protein
MFKKYFSFSLYLSFLLSVFIWIIDAGFDTFFFHEDTFLNQLILNVSAHEIYTRILSIVIILASVLISIRIIKRMTLVEEKLRESERNYQTVADYTFDWEYWIDPDGKYKYISPSCKTITGYDRKEFYDDPDFMKKILHPDDIELFLKHEYHNNRPENPEKIEFRIIKVNGEEQWIQHVCQPIIDPDGNYLGIRASNREITDRVYMEKSLEENIHFLQIFLDNIPNPVYYKDEERRYIACNYAFEKVFGVVQNQIIGKTVFDIHPRELAEKYDEMDKNLLEDKKDQSFEYKVRYADGSLRDVVFHKTILTKLDGSITGLIGIFFDITERKKNEEIIIESELKYRSLFENMLNSFAYFKIVYDNENSPVDFLLIEANSAFENIIGKKLTEISGESINKIFEGINESGLNWEKQLRNVAITGISIRFEQFFLYIQKWFLISVYSPNDQHLALIFSDITDQKMVEKFYEISLEKYKVLFESFPLGIIILDKESYILESNKESERLLESKFIKNTKFDYHSSEWEIIRTDGSLMSLEEFVHYRALKEQRLIENSEMGFIKPDNTILWLNVNAVPLPIENYGVVVTFSDISQRKTIEKELEYERFLLSTLMNTVPDNIYFKDRKSRYIRINKAHAEWFGLNNPDEIEGKTDAVFFDQNYVYSLYEDEQKLINEETEIIKKEENEIWLDGHTSWVSTIKVPFRDKDGYIIGTIGISRNISERKEMEKIVNERIIALTQPLGDIGNITFETLFDIDEIQKIQDAFAEATGVASIITRTNGEPITRPSNFCNLCTNVIRSTDLGYFNCQKSDAFIGRLNPSGPIYQHCLSGGLMDGGASISIGNHHIANWLIGQVLDDEPNEEIMIRYADEIGADKNEYLKALKEVNRMPKEQFEIICNALFIIARQLSTMAIQNVQQARNISERIAAEEKAMQLNEEITLKNRELEQIVYVTSHDLRSPLVNIQGFSKEIQNSFNSLSQMIKKSDSQNELNQKIMNLLDEDIPESLHFILASTIKMDSLLKGLLKLSRMGRSAPNLKYIDMNKFISNVLKVFEYQFKEKNFIVDVSDLPPCIGDEAQLDQLFSNLIDNTIKYMDYNKQPVLKIFGRKIEKKSLYCIEDNGIGIAPEHKEKVFEIFYRLNTDISAGEGLGLTIARKIVEKHNGKIWVDSRTNQGSKFHILLSNI